MKSRFFFLSGLVLIQLGSWSVAQSLPDLNLVPPRAKIAILPAHVTVDGRGDPVFGQSLGDILNGALLSFKTVDLLDASLPVVAVEALPAPAATSALMPPVLEKNGPASGALIFPNPLPQPTATPAPAPTPSQAAPPAMSPVETGKAIGADYVVIPTVIGAGQDFRLTLRQIQIPSGKIRAIVNEKTTRGIKGVYALAENAAFRLVPTPPAAPRRSAGPSIVDHPVRLAPPEPEAESPADLAMAPKALSPISPAKLAAIEATKRLIGVDSKASNSSAANAEPIKVGTIGSVSLDWSFCTFSPAKGTSLPPGTALFVCAAGNPDNTIKLSVTRREGNSIIADFGQNSRAADIVPGDKVYQWQTPAPRP